MPAGPLREPAAAAAARCRAAVLIGVDRAAARAALGGLSVLEAWLTPARALPGERVFAFCGIGRPAKFFDTVAASGAVLAGTAAFPDHHPYSNRDLERVLAAAAERGARPLTTPKDHARLSPEWRRAVDVLGVQLSWRDAAAIEQWLDEALA